MNTPQVRKASTTPRHLSGILVLHYYQDLPSEDVQASEGFLFTRPLRTTLDLIEADSVERVSFQQALSQALHRGLITHHQVRSVNLSGAARAVLDDLLRRVA